MANWTGRIEEKKRWFQARDKQGKPLFTKGGKPKLIPNPMWLIHLSSDKFEATFHFKVTQRKGRFTYTDSRDMARYTLHSVQPELSRFVGEGEAIRLLCEVAGIDA